MRKKLFNSLLFFVLVCLFSNTIEAQSTKYKTLKSINDLSGSSPDTCYISGYVSSIYECPFCPPGAECKPCIGDHVMLGVSLTARAKNLRVLTKDLKNYAIGKKYTFLVKLHKDGKKKVFEAVSLNNKN